MNIKHYWVFKVNESGFFSNLKSYDDLVTACNSFAENNEFDREDPRWEDTRKERVGAAFEVYTEFFLGLYGSSPLMSVVDIQHTSDDKYHVGDDFGARDLEGRPKLIQVKFRNRADERFTRSDLGTFVSKCDEDDVPKSHRILFTNLEHKVTDKSNGVFCTSYAAGLKQMKVFDRLMQEQQLDRDPTFWSRFADALIRSSARPKAGSAPRLRSHQVEMLTAIRANMFGVSSPAP
jgi:hypothetical protein